MSLRRYVFTYLRLYVFTSPGVSGEGGDMLLRRYVFTYLRLYVLCSSGASREEGRRHVVERLDGVR